MTDDVLFCTVFLQWPLVDPEPIPYLSSGTAVKGVLQMAIKCKNHLECNCAMANDVAIQTRYSS